MSKITIVGGDIIEHIGGKDLSYAKDHIINIGSQVIQSGKKNGVTYGEPNRLKFYNDVDKEGPWLVLRSAKKKGRNPSDTATADDLLYGDYTEDASGLAKLKQELKQEYITEEKRKKKDIFPLIKPSDEFIRTQAETFAQYRIDKLSSYLKKTNDQLFEIFINDIKSWSMNDLEDVAVDIVGKMKKNTGGIYTHKALTYAAKNHATFVDFANITEDCIADFISNGKKIEDLVITMNSKFNPKEKLYKAIREKKAERPVFNTVHDTINGLRILVNDVWAYEVRVLRYRKHYINLFIELEYTLYDHFGLDVPDICKFDKEIFYVWFILQHFRGFKPLITKMQITREYPMIVPENWK